jgi:multicomponent Na+:H+ antiporter subunit G
VVGDAVTLVLLATGLACFAVAAVGVLRLLDALSRPHAVAMADNLGLGLIVAALAVPAGLDPAAVELALIWLLVLFAPATACWALARGVDGDRGDGGG